MIDRLAAAASIAVRHAGAYTDLILSDVEVAGGVVRQRLIAVTLLGGATVLAVALGCVLLIVICWNTAARLWAIAALIGLFTGIAAIAYRQLQRLDATAPGVLERTAREWAKDRTLLEDLIEREREAPHGN